MKKENHPTKCVCGLWITNVSTLQPVSYLLKSGHFNNEDKNHPKILSIKKENKIQIKEQVLR